MLDREDLNKQENYIMPKSEFKKIAGPKVISMQELEIGELGEIVEECGYKGTVVTRTYNDRFVGVFDPKGYSGFRTTWCGSPNINVRVLEKGEQIILSND
jgi:hypothetical protein